ncbi:hypothetical protein MTP99_003854 [Tenebrio molitor]|jgi:hypothetical protein|nr:hypothetical protein MTP99_003854 [Tenebrio molitor]
MMNVFEEVLLHYQDKNFELIQFLQSLPPVTPTDAKIIMCEFDLDDLRNCILFNISSQGLDLEPNTIHALMEFLNGDFTDTTKKIYQQVLLHLTKMNTKLMLEKYVRNLQGLSRAAFFDSEIASFVQFAVMSYGADETISTVSDDLKSEIQKALLSNPMLNAFDSAMKKVLDPKYLYIPEIKQNISKIKIYWVRKFAPLSALRGVCLTDGIMLCTGNLAGPTGSISYQADLTTLVAHECGDYLARLHFNFSSPFLIDSQEDLRTDPIDPMVPLELGRYVELLLFDGIQPIWHKSSVQAATTFMERLHSAETTPIIKENEHKVLKLVERGLPSLPFGIDLIEEQDMFW